MSLRIIANNITADARRYPQVLSQLQALNRIRLSDEVMTNVRLLIIHTLYIFSGVHQATL